MDTGEQTGNLSDQQDLFSEDLGYLYMYLIAKHIKFTLGECWRPEVTQVWYYNQGLSQTVDNSRHLVRMAQDINFFLDEGWVGELEAGEAKRLLQHIGDFWESLDGHNRWGGNWESLTDVSHFERI